MSDRVTNKVPRAPLLEIEEIQEELMYAAELQRHIMPHPERMMAFGGYDIFGMTQPIAVVGGDFFTFIDLEGRFGIKGKLGVVIADAAGHGLVAAMLVRDFNTALHIAIAFQSYYVNDTTPLLFTKINRRMYRSSQRNQFISAFYGELWLDGTLRYINAGHYSPCLLNRDQVVWLDVGGPVLGAFYDLPQDYQVGEVHLDEGDVLVAFTDGVIEAVNDGGEEYGLARLVQTVQASSHESSRQIYNRIIQDVEEFSKVNGQTDDRTVLVVKAPEKAGT